MIVDFLCVGFWLRACGGVSNPLLVYPICVFLPKYIFIPEQWAIETHGSPQFLYVSSHADEHNSSEGCLTQVLFLLMFALSEFGKIQAVQMIFCVRAE